MKPTALINNYWTLQWYVAPFYYHGKHEYKTGNFTTVSNNYI